jgi:hypothetical protein
VDPSTRINSNEASSGLPSDVAVDVWSFPNGLGHSVIADIAGYQVVATDGEIGHVDLAVDQITERLDGSAIVVDTGFWIFGKKRMIPAGVIDSIDAEQRTVQVMMTKDQIKHAPDYVDEPPASDAHGQHRDLVTDYYTRWWG